MKRTFLKLIGAASAAALIAGVAGGSAQAESLMQMVKSGKTIKIGYSNEAPYAFRNKAGQMDGFVNVVALAVLKKMGAKKVEGVLTEWSALIPGLKASRFDIITAGMYILPKRCKHVAFTEPMGVFAEAFMVKKGNPMKLHSFDDVKKSAKAILVTGRGYATVGHAKKIGIPAGRIMQVPDPAAMLQAVKAGRAHAASATVFAIKDLVKKGGGDVELAQPFNAPDFTKGYSGYAFRKADADFVAAFNKELKAYLGTPAMLTSVAKYGYGKGQVPTGAKTTADLCKG